MSEEGQIYQIEKQVFVEYSWPYNYPNYEKYYPLETKTGFLLKGFICFTDAVTTKKDVIDSIEAPWYHVFIGGGEESLPVAAWIWGGYCLDAENLSEREVTIQGALTELAAAKSKREKIIDR